MPTPAITPAQTDALAKLAEIPAVGSEELERLSKDAAAGPWSVSGARRSFSERSCVFIDAPSCAGLLVLATGQGAQALEALRDARFVVALVNAYRSGKLISTPLVEDTEGGGEKDESLTPMGSGSHPSDRTPSGSAGYAVSILRAALVQAAEEQVRYWRERQSRETCPEDRMDDDGNYTPMGDDAAISFGRCNGRYSEADWWLKTLQTMPMPQDDRDLCKCRIGSCHLLTQRCREVES